MPRTAQLTATLAASVIAAGTLAGCTLTSVPQPAPPSAPIVTRTAPPAPELPELPDWARGSTWLIYPDGFECGGTEGCPNDYRALIGEPGPVLPRGVEYYDPAKHDCVVVAPLNVDCSG